MKAYACPLTALPDITWLKILVSVNLTTAQTAANWGMHANAARFVPKENASATAVRTRYFVNMTMQVYRSPSAPILNPIPNSAAQTMIAKVTNHVRMAKHVLKENANRLRVRTEMKSSVSSTE